MAEGAPLLREYGLKAHRGFESLHLRQIPNGPAGSLGICGKGGLGEEPSVRAEHRRCETTPALPAAPKG